MGYPASGLGHQSVSAYILFSRLCFLPNIRHQSKVQQTVSPVKSSAIVPYLRTPINKIHITAEPYFPVWKNLPYITLLQYIVPFMGSLVSFLPVSAILLCSWNAGLSFFRCICCRNYLIFFCSIFFCVFFSYLFM